MSAPVRPIRVLLIDSRPVVLKGLNELVNAEKPRMEVVGNADRYAKALDLADRTHPDVILFSFFPDALNPLEVIAGLARQGNIKVLLLKGLYDEIPVAKAIEAGARGVLLTEDPTGSIVRAIIKVRDHDVGLNRVWTSGLSSLAAREHVHVVADPEQAKLASLTTRERELIRAIAADPSAKYMSIAQRLGISEHTVHNHLSSIYHKLGLINRIDLLVYALKHQLVDGQEYPESGWAEVN